MTFEAIWRKSLSTYIYAKNLSLNNSIFLLSGDGYSENYNPTEYI